MIPRKTAIYYITSLSKPKMFVTGTKRAGTEINIIQDVRFTSHNNLKTYFQGFTATKRANNQATGGIDLAKANSSRTREEE